MNELLWFVLLAVLFLVFSSLLCLGLLLLWFTFDHRLSSGRRDHSKGGDPDA